MFMRIFVAIVIIIGVALGIGALPQLLSHDKLVQLFVLRDFFDVPLPILAFGALVKYLCTPIECCCKHCSNKKDSH